MSQVEQLEHDVTKWLEDATVVQMVTVLDALASELRARGLNGAMYASHAASSLHAYVVAERVRRAALISPECS